MGSTLSSDLLSLCLVADQCLLSGGVDGRIHIWSLNPLDMEPLQSSRVHDGRVNAMVYASQMKVLFSVGHDGSIIASKLWKGHRGLETISKLLVGEPPVRLSTLCLVNECKTDCRLVVGTTEGKVINIDVSLAHDGINLVEESRLSIDGEPMVYCLGIVCSSKDASEQSTILVGQAYGLIAIQI
jgi:WD40 repeat protein